MSDHVLMLSILETFHFCIKLHMVLLALVPMVSFYFIKGEEWSFTSSYQTYTLNYGALNMIFAE